MRANSWWVEKESLYIDGWLWTLLLHSFINSFNFPFSFHFIHFTSFHLLGPTLPYTDLGMALNLFLMSSRSEVNCVSGLSEFIWKGFCNSVLWLFSTSSHLEKILQFKILRALLSDIISRSAALTALGVGLRLALAASRRVSGADRRQEFWTS